MNFQVEFSNPYVISASGFWLELWKRERREDCGQRRDKEKSDLTKTGVGTIVDRAGREFELLAKQRAKPCLKTAAAQTISRRANSPCTPSN